MKTTKLFRIALLAAGALVSWYTVLSQFFTQYSYCGTVLPASQCLIQSPFVTPCFYGACAFLMAFIASVWMYKRDNDAHEAYLRNFLLFGLVFALSVLTVECAQYFDLLGGPSIGCTPGSNPLLSPCAAGALLFGGSFALSVRLAQSRPNVVSDDA